MCAAAMKLCVVSPYPPELNGIGEYAWNVVHGMAATGRFSAISDAVGGTAAGRAALRLISGDLTYPPLGDAERRKLAAYYVDDVRQLSSLAGRDLNAWVA